MHSPVYEAVDEVCYLTHISVLKPVLYGALFGMGRIFFNMYCRSIIACFYILCNSKHQVLFLYYFSESHAFGSTGLPSFLISKNKWLPSLV